MTSLGGVVQVELAHKERVARVVQVAVRHRRLAARRRDRQSKDRPVDVAGHAAEDQLEDADQEASVKICGQSENSAEDRLSRTVQVEARIESNCHAIWEAKPGRSQ